MSKGVGSPTSVFLRVECPTQFNTVIPHCKLCSAKGRYMTYTPTELCVMDIEWKKGNHSIYLQTIQKYMQQKIFNVVIMLLSRLELNNVSAGVGLHVISFWQTLIHRIIRHNRIDLFGCIVHAIDRLHLQLNWNSFFSNACYHYKKHKSKDLIREILRRDTNPFVTETDQWESGILFLMDNQDIDDILDDIMKHLAQKPDNDITWNSLLLKYCHFWTNVSIFNKLIQRGANNFDACLQNCCRTTSPDGGYRHWSYMNIFLLISKGGSVPHFLPQSCIRELLNLGTPYELLHAKHPHTTYHLKLERDRKIQWLKRELSTLLYAQVIDHILVPFMGY
jgi:hypothetical protein